MASFPTHQTLIQQHSQLVRSIARRMSSRLPSHLEEQDLVQDGTIGLMEAIERYDDGRGVKFQTFAATRIRGSILDGLRQHDWVSRGGRRRVREMNKAEESLSQDLKRTPTEAELAQHTSLTVQEIKRRRREGRQSVVLALDDVTTGAEASRVPDARADVETTFARQETSRDLSASLERLDQREAMILKMYYHQELGVKEIAAQLGVSSARVSQLHTRALGKMRTRLQEIGYTRAC